MADYQTMVLESDLGQLARALEDNEDIVIVLPRIPIESAHVLVAYNTLLRTGYRVRILGPDGREILSGA